MSQRGLIGTNIFSRCVVLLCQPFDHLLVIFKCFLSKKHKLIQAPNKGLNVQLHRDLVLDLFFQKKKKTLLSIVGSLFI